MSTVSITELSKPLSLEQVRASIYAALAAIGTSTATWKPGAVVRTMITGCAIVLAAFSHLVAFLAKSGFLETAEGDWLKQHANDNYGIETTAFEGTFAAGTLTINNPTGGVFGPFAAEAVLFTCLTTGKTYRNTGVLNVPALTSGIACPIRAVEGGASSSAVPGSITQITSPAMAGVLCTNATALVGTDASTNAEIRTLCRESLGPLSPNGPSDAYSYAARNARTTAGDSAGVTRIRTSPDGFGRVYVYVATASGAITGSASDPSTPLGAVADAIYEAAEPLGVTAVVATATAKVIPVTYEVWLYDNSGLTLAQIHAAISAALGSYMAAQPIGGNVVGGGAGKIYTSDLVGVVKSALPGIFRIAVTLPAADVVLVASEVPVLGAVTAEGINQETARFV